jgi:hypothetical protein
MPCPSSDHLAEILTDLYNNREKLEATAELCYQRVTDPQFSWDTIANQFMGVFQEVLDGVFDETHSETLEVQPVEKKRKKRKKHLIGYTDY